MPDIVIERKSKNGSWRVDAMYYGPDAQERAADALQSKIEALDGFSYRIQEPKKPMTYEEMVKSRFRSRDYQVSERWIMGD
jgi:hypothetical protein